MSRWMIAFLVSIALLSCKAESRGATRVSRVEPASDTAAGAAAPQNRMIIRNASLSIVVADTVKAAEKITATAEAFGGYVSNSKTWREGELLRATITFRVPAEKLAPALAAVRGAAVRVQNESVSSEEVTEEYVDLQARLLTLQATETELKQLMTTVRVNSGKASEVLEMHQHLMDIRSEIERVMGRMRYLGQMTALATVTADVVPDAIAKPVVEPGWQAVVVLKDAAGALVKASQVAATVLIWMLVYFVPMIAAAGLVIWLLRRVYLRYYVTSS